jgi:hypothetical protein
MHLLPKVDSTFNTTFTIKNSVIKCNESANIELFSQLKDLSAF